MSSGTSERVQVKDLNERVASLQSQVQIIEKENQKLGSEFTKASSNVSIYLQELHNILDSHELSSTSGMNMDVDGDSEEEDTIGHHHL